MAVILEELQARVRAVARPEEDINGLIELAVQEFVAHREAATRGDAARAEAKAILQGLRRVADPQSAYQHDREVYGWTQDLSGLNDEELADRHDQGLTGLSDDKAAAAKRLGLL